MVSGNEYGMGLWQQVKETVSNTFSSSESLDPQQQLNAFRSGISKLKHGSEFINDIFNDETLDVHAEMRQTYRMMLNHIKARRAAELKAQLMLGNNLTVETDDEETKQFFDETIIPRLRGPLETAAINACMTGNGHVEVKRGERSGTPMDFEEMTRPHKIYNKYEQGKGFRINGYVQEAFRKTANNNDFESFQVLAGEQRTKRVTGTFFDAKDVIHLRVGTSPMPGYGRSIWCSGIDDYKVYRELMRAQALIARHKSIPRKAFIFEGGDDGGSGVDMPQTGSDPSAVKQRRENKLDSMRPDENPVFHNEKLSIKDYSYDVRRDQIQGVMDGLNKNLTSGAPSFVTEPGETNRATAAEERPLFQMEVASIRETWRDQIDKRFREIADARGLDESVSIKFGEFDFPTRDQKLDETLRLWNDGLITVRQALNRLPVDVELADEAVGDAFEWELDRGDDPFSQLGQKIDDVADVDAEHLEELIRDGA